MTLSASRDTEELVDTGVLGLRDAEGRWRGLPDWARYYLETGAGLWRTPIDGQRCVVAVSAPTRAYAAVLCAVGTVLAQHQAESAASADERFRDLSAMEHGEPVNLLIKKNGKWRSVPGRFCGMARDSSERIRIEYGNSAASELPASLIWRVARSGLEEGGLPAGTGRSRQLKSVNLFTEAILSPQGARQFAAGGGVACLIVGSLKRLAAEAQCEGFASRGHGPDAKPSPGVLEDLVRLQKPSADSGSCRTAVHSPHASPRKALDAAPPVVIFDGASGYLNVRDRFRSSHAVVVLDRTEPQFGAAVRELQADYDMKRLDDSTSWPLPAAPLCVEAHRFWLACA